MTTNTNELHAAIYTTQTLLKQAADVIEQNMNSLAEAHTRNGIIEDTEVQACIESDADLIAELRAAALPWAQRHKPATQHECLCKDKCLHIGPMALCKGLPSPLAQPAPVQKTQPEPPFTFRRFVAGSERAQDVAVHREVTLDAAIRVAAKICPPADHPTVLVYTPPAALAPEGMVLVPKRMTQAMRDVTDQEDWTWEDLLAAAEAITEDEYNEIATPPAAQPAPVQEPLTWYEGAPPFPQDQEWFIAETIYGDRVVLRSLDEGRKHKGDYAFKTADQTYMKQEIVKRWMQFPDCEYLPPAAQPAVPLTPEQVHALDPAPHQMFDQQRIDFARAIEAAHGITEECKPASCTWTKSPDPSTPDTYSATCGAVWTFTDGGPTDNDMHFCPKCGNKVVEGGAHEPV